MLLNHLVECHLLLEQIVTCCELLFVGWKTSQFFECILYELICYCLFLELLCHIVTSLINVLLYCVPYFLIFLESEEVIFVDINELCRRTYALDRPSIELTFLNHVL